MYRLISNDFAIWILLEAHPLYDCCGSKDDYIINILVKYPPHLPYFCC